MEKLEIFTYSLGLSILFFGIISTLLYYLFFKDNIFKKIFFKLKVKNHVRNMIKELDSCI